MFVYQGKQFQTQNLPQLAARPGVASALGCTPLAKASKGRTPGMLVHFTFGNGTSGVDTLKHSCLPILRYRTLHFTTPPGCLGVPGQILHISQPSTFSMKFFFICSGLSKINVTPLRFWKKSLALRRKINDVTPLRFWKVSSTPTQNQQDV